MALAPCPFCGSEGHTLLRGYRYADGFPDRKEPAVCCPTCEARAPVKAWNTRIQPDREAVARCLVQHDANYSTYHMPGDKPRKWKAASGAVYDTSELSTEAANRVRDRADAVVSLLSVQVDGEQKITRLTKQELPGAVVSLPSPAWPTNLHPRTLDLVQRFAAALAKKLRLAEEKYGFGDGWADDNWEQECRAHLYSHIEKGDPRDVAAYCAFMWHHGWITSQPSVAETNADAPGDAKEFAELNFANVLQEASARLAQARLSPDRLTKETNTLEYWCAWAAHENARCLATLAAEGMREAVQPSIATRPATSGTAASGTELGGEG